MPSRILKSRSRKGQNNLQGHRLRDIAQIVQGRLVGDGETLITGICGIKEAKAGDLTFVANSKYLQLLESTKASAVITTPDVKSSSVPLVWADNPSLAFAKLVPLFAPAMDQHPRGVSPKAVIGKKVKLGPDVAIGPFVVVEDEVQIGDRSILYAGCYVGRQTRIGNDCLVYPNVSIREKVEIGHRVIIHSGTVLGSDGFGFATMKGIHHKIPQIGMVVIEDDVEIGSNVTIDRARFGKTVIGKGTKIDNLVQIAHNVETGAHCILVAQSGVSGSTVLGNNVVLAGQSGVVGHITLGDNVHVGAQSGVSKSVPANENVWGTPAKPLSRSKRVNASLQRLPELWKTVEILKQKIEEIKKDLERNHAHS